MGEAKNNLTVIETKKIKLKELRDITGSLAKLVTMDLPVKISYRMTKIAKLIKNELQEVEDQRTELVKKYGEKTEQGLMVKEKIEEFNKEFNEFLDEEIEISYIPVNLSSIEDRKLSALDMLNLEIFIKDDDDEVIEGEVKNE